MCKCVSAKGSAHCPVPVAVRLDNALGGVGPARRCRKKRMCQPIFPAAAAAGDGVLGSEYIQLRVVFAKAVGLIIVAVGVSAGL